MEERHNVPSHEPQQAELEDAIDGVLKICVPQAEVVLVRVEDSGGPGAGSERSTTHGATHPR
jgi:hypothetical protein